MPLDNTSYRQEAVKHKGLCQLNHLTASSTLILQRDFTNQISITGLITMQEQSNWEPVRYDDITRFKLLYNIVQ